MPVTDARDRREHRRRRGVRGRRRDDAAPDSRGRHRAAARREREVHRRRAEPRQHQRHAYYYAPYYRKDYAQVLPAVGHERLSRGVHHLGAARPRGALAQTPSAVTERTPLP